MVEHTHTYTQTRNSVDTQDVIYTETSNKRVVFWLKR